MPEISRFYGIVVAMFYNDHAPPHFHARYGSYEAQVRIDPAGILEGELPRRAIDMVLEWAAAHRAELLENWNLLRAAQAPNKIAPLR